MRAKVARVPPRAVTWRTVSVSVHSQIRWLLGGLALALLSCKGHEAPAGSTGEPAPSSSVISVGVALGTCTDLALCESECDAGSADRCRRLASTYAVGNGVAKDEARATSLYELACDKGDPPACVFAGQMHEYAHGVPKDDARATKLYSRACDAGWVPGCYNLAIMLETGHGVPQDRARALDLYDQACRAGAQPGCEKAKFLRGAPAAAPGEPGEAGAPARAP